MPLDLHVHGLRQAAVAAPHARAVAAGQRVLVEGGNAVEAMVAMGAAIAAVYPHMTHLGGDAFWLIREPKGRVRYIEACGFAGAKASERFYRDLGHDTIPERGPLAALTVPGVLGGCGQALDLSREAYGGKLPLRVLFEPAIEAARGGYTVTRSQAALTAAKLADLNASPGFADTFLVDGKPPEEGATLRQTRLADTLDHLAQAGLEDVYRGDVGREIAADLARIGSPVTRADLEAFHARMAAPLSVPHSRGTLYNAPPPTQGLASLIILALFDRLRVTKGEDFEHVHGLIEATKRAFLVRDRVVTDPDRMTQDPAQYLAAGFLDQEAGRIDARRALKWPQPAQRGDTIWMGAADASGLVVSYIQSIFFEFGSGCVLPATGLLMQNRGASFSLNPKALNPVQPGRRPFHTLNPALAVLKDGRVMAYGTMGGEGQPQTQAMLFTRHVLFRDDLGKALDRPRWLLGRTWGSSVTNLRLENRFDERLIDRLMDAGHDVTVLDEAYSDTMGHAGAVVLHPDGRMEAAHDPRADGGADGL
jgi:gamma-glutamyltranspeptidase/glutathione hydrolase